MTTFAPRRRLLSSMKSLLSASRSSLVTSAKVRRGISEAGNSLHDKLRSPRHSFGGVCEDTGNNSILDDTYNLKGLGVTVSGDSITGSKGGTGHQRKFERISGYCVPLRRPEDLLVDGYPRAGLKGAVAAIELSREHATADLDLLQEPSCGNSSLSRVLEQVFARFGLGSAPRIRIRFHSRDCSQGNRRSYGNDCPSFSLNSCSSLKLTYSYCDRAESFMSSSCHLLTSSGRAHLYERVLPLHFGFQSLRYSTSSQRTPSVSENHEDDSGKTDGEAGLGGKQGPEKSWIQVVFPENLWSYAQLARLEKPIGTWLLAWPCFWSICLAAPSGGLPDLKILGWFGLGAILLRSAGCTVNDLLDSDIDGKVERTQRRPIASGMLTPFQGLSFLGFQLLLGLGVLLQLNDFSKILGASSLVLVGTYPLMKRWTFWPQAFLGLTINWGALLGWAAIQDSLDLSVVFPLYASGVCWTLVYDTIYAHQDKEDDIKVGVKSTALRFGDETRPWLIGFSTGCVTCLTLAGFNCGIGWPFYVGVAAAAGHLAWQVFTVDIHNRLDCNSKFLSNKWYGAIVCSAIVLGKLTESSS